MTTEASVRRHHYEFAHRTLPDVVLSGRFDLLEMAEQGVLAQALLGAWEALGEAFPQEERLAPDGLAVWPVDLAGGRALLVRFPPVRSMPEALLAAAVPGAQGGPTRYLTLEFAGAEDGEVQTMIGEWEGEVHRNWGTGPEPDPNAFVVALEQLLAPTTGRLA
jgi:hypothetical protein